MTSMRFRDSFSRNGYCLVPIASHEKVDLINGVLASVVDRLATIGKQASVDRPLELNEVLSQLTDQQWISAFGTVSFRMLNDHSARLSASILTSLVSKIGFPEAFTPHLVTDSDLALNSGLTRNTVSVYYRLVRAGKPHDVGGAHRDADFWDETITPLPRNHKGKARIKVWIPLLGCTNQNSLKVIPGSHLHDISTRYETIQGRVKPRIDPLYLDAHRALSISPFDSMNQAIIFHDRLVHWADANESGNPLRVSLESTMLSSRERH